MTLTPRPPTYTPPPTATRRPTVWATPTFVTGARSHRGTLMTMTPVPTRDESLEHVAAAPVGGPVGTGTVLVGVCGGVVLLLALAALALAWKRGAVKLALARWMVRRTPEEKKKLAELKAHQKQEAARTKQLRAIAKELARNVRKVLTGMGYTHAYANPGQKRKMFEEIRFSHAVIIGEEQVLLRVERVPTFKTRWELFKPEPGQPIQTVQHGQVVSGYIAAELYLALGRQVNMIFWEEMGIFIQIALREGVAGVPRLVLWRDPEKRRFSAMDGDPWDNGQGAMPDVSKDPRYRLSLPLGQGRNRKVVHGNLVYMPHVIISGTTGSGKSTALSAWICCWLERNTPETLQLYLIDLKIVEFAAYRRLSPKDEAPRAKSIIANVIQNEEEAVEELKALYAEIVRRQNLIQGVCVDLDGWNEYARHAPAEAQAHPLPRIVVVFDELSIIMLSPKKETRDVAKDFIAKCVAVGRSSGVHLVLCTQVVSKAVLDLLIQGNTPAKLIFKQANRTASINALGDGRAWSHIEQPGMAYFCDERGGEELVQTPLIYEFQRDEIIEAERARIDLRDQEPKALTILDIVTYAVANFGGVMRDRDMWAEFKGRISLADMRGMIKAHFGQYFWLNDCEYTIEQGVTSRPTKAVCTYIPLALRHLAPIVLDEIPPETVIPSNGKVPALPEPASEPAEISEAPHNSVDELYAQALAIVRETGKRSAPLLQRRLRINYVRAARLLDRMAEETKEAV